MHAQRKDWTLRSVHVDVHLEVHGQDRALIRKCASRAILTRRSARDWQTSPSAHPLR